VPARVLLFNPAVRVGKEQQRRTGIPLGLLAIASPLDNEGYPVVIIDQTTQPDWRARLQAELDKHPVCVGVTSKTGPQIRFALEASRLVKMRSNVPVVWGGVHASLLPAQTLADPAVDIVVQGEGDATFPELVKALEIARPLDEVRGLWFKRDGKIVGTGPRPFVDLDALPSPAYHLVDLKAFMLRSFDIDHIRISSSRGCPYGCGFCYNTVFYQRRWRSLSARRTVDEIRRLHHEHGVRGIRFADDLFFGDVERVREILKLIIAERLDVMITKLDLHVAQLEKIDDELLDLLQRAGAKALVVGVESGSQRILDLIDKNLRVEQVLDFNRRLRRTGLIPRYCFMMGFPTETLDDIRASIRVIMQLLDENPEAMKDINVYTPYPGTALFEVAVKHGFVPPQRLEDWVPFNWRTVNRARMPWITPERERLMQMLHCSSLFLEKNNFITPLWPTHPLVRLGAWLYRPLARWRVAHLDARCPLEIKLVEALRLYPKQE
jgi:anaerobic magnesium-protoporphyrin IX monomethyl ester cyclase